MQEPANPFSAWENFWVIVSSAGAALTGLQFVVIALVSDLRQRRTSDQIDAFATPTIVHFGAVLLLGAILSAPWRSLSSAAIALGISGAAAVLYTVLVLRRLNRQSAYAPVLEDWLFHALFPFLAYVTVLVSAIALSAHTADALFGVASAAVLLLFVGIHNAWDTVTFLTTNPDVGAPNSEESAK